MYQEKAMPKDIKSTVSFSPPKVEEPVKELSPKEKADLHEKNKK